MKRILLLVATLMLLIGQWSCDSTSPSSPISSSPAKTTVPSGTVTTHVSPISWLLRTVPSSVTTPLMYNNIPVLSAYEDVTIPARQDSQEEKTEWWRNFERSILYGYSFPGIVELWGFDNVDLQGILTFWTEDSSSLTVLGGTLDTDAFREKMKSHQYVEEEFLGYPVLSGIPSFDDSPALSDILPRAFGIIKGMEVNGGTVNLILMANRREDCLLLEDEVNQAKNAIKVALQAYHEKTSLAYQAGGITALASSLGDTGSVFVSSASDLSFQTTVDGLRQQDRDKYKSYIGPGRLNPYEQMAITLKKNGEATYVTFILVYENQEQASKNIEVLEERLKSAQSVLQNKALSEYWTVQEVYTEGPYLQAIVKVNQPQPTDGTGYFFVGSIWANDLWFLFPGSAESL